MSMRTPRKILIPSNHTTEALVQGELYRVLVSNGIRCILEYVIERSRFDCAVVNSENHLAVIIECKNYRDPNHAYNAATKQFAKYSQYGVPVIGCVRMADIEDVVAQVKAILEAGLSGPEPVSSPAPSSTTPAIDLREKRRVVKSTGLVSRQWIPWHCKVIDAIGPSTYLDIADIAAKGKDPRTLFSRLLKDEYDDCS